METKESSCIQLPKGFRFHPSDEELIVHYLKNKVNSRPLPASIIAEIDLYKYNPWELPKKAVFGEDEWYFFTPRDRKYPNGARPNRTASAGYWKATGTDKPIFSSTGKLNIGVKKALVFYKGRPPRGFKTDWIMHEYRLLELDSVFLNPKKKRSMRLDDWVVCRVRQKSLPTNAWEHQTSLGFELSAGYIPKVNELPQTNNKNNFDMIKNDCPMLPYIFASQAFPCINGKVPSFSFQSTDKPRTCEEDSDDKSLQFSVTPLDDLLNPSKRKFLERNDQLDDCILPIKRPLKENMMKEEVAVSISNDGTDVNLCGTDQSEGSYFSPTQWNSLMQYEELDYLDFTESN